MKMTTSVWFKCYQVADGKLSLCLRRPIFDSPAVDKGHSPV